LLTGMIQYSIRLRDVHASDMFGDLADDWMSSRGEGGIDNGLYDKVVSNLAGSRWEDDEAAFGEIDMLTSTFALCREM
jgi:hypothetical protein